MYLVLILQFDCYMSRLTTIGEWTDRHDQRQSYFTGANYHQEICACGAEANNTCFKLPGIDHSMNQCNCDQKDPVLRNDAGYITNKVHLL